MTIGDALRRHEPELLAVPGVSRVGIGEADGHEVIVVFVERDPGRVDEVVELVPKALDGYLTAVRPEISVFPGRPEESQRKDHHNAQ
jgi:hypothetical protein